MLNKQVFTVCYRWAKERHQKEHPTMDLDVHLVAVCMEQADMLDPNWSPDKYPDPEEWYETISEEVEVLVAAGISD